MYAKGQELSPVGGGGDTAYERGGDAGNFELNPKGDRSGRGPSFF